MLDVYCKSLSYTIRCAALAGQRLCTAGPCHPEPTPLPDAFGAWSKNRLFGATALAPRAEDCLSPFRGEFRRLAKAVAEDSLFLRIAPRAFWLLFGGAKSNI